MADKAQAIIERLNEVTNINNIKYSNTLNTTSNVTSISEVITTPCSLGVLADEVAFMPQDKLPPKWNAVKIDLFNNGTADKPKRTVKFTIVKEDDSKFPCSAALNSPYHHVYRGMDEGLGTKRFWRAVDTLIEQHKQADQSFSISKIGKVKKGGSIPDLATAVYEKGGVWYCQLINYNEIYTYPLGGVMHDEFKNKNGIATGFWGTIKRNWTSREELGI